MLDIILKPLGILIFKLLFKLEVEGKENVPRRGGIILAANHSSFLDPLILVVAAPRKIYYVMLREIYEFKPLKWFFIVTSCIPINGAVKRALETLRKGRVLGIFPEGTRSKDGKLREGKTGVAVLAMESGAPVIPVGIIGTYEAYPPQVKLPRPHPVKVRFGSPLSFPWEKERGEPSDEALKDVTAQIMDRIGELMR